MKTLALVAIVCTLSACTASQRYIAAGETLHTTAREFVAVGEGMKKGLETGKISGDDYREWAEFAQRFDLFYAEAVEAWNLAQSIESKVDEKRYGEAILEFAAEVGRFYAKLKDAGLLPRGAP